MKILSTILAASISLAAWAMPERPVPDKDPAYTKMLNERAAKIIEPLGITDTAQADRVQGLIVQQYRNLSGIHDARDAQLKAAKELAGEKAATAAAIEAAKVDATNKLNKLHVEYLVKLSNELSPEQVTRVKDGMTYGVVDLTYNTYLKMYPELTEEQKKQVMAWLVEAREIAMDQGTANEKHAVFGKYKGRINNYLSRAGYDAKKGAENLKKASQPASETTPK
jgi:hypothetical protein